MRRVLACLVLGLLFGAGLSAADFWETKPFLDWSDKEVEKIFSNSPWAALVAVPLPPSAPVPSADGGLGRGRGGGDDRSFGPAPRRVRLVVAWRSAQPLKRALVRQAVGQHGTVPPDTQAMLDADDELYVVSVQGLPPQFARPGSDSGATAFLRRDGKPPIPAREAGSQMTRGGSLLLIGFPRTDPIVLEDGEVEFELMIGPLHVKKKFKLKDLTFEGKLAL